MNILYEFYNTDNTLLYIGITDNFPRRLNEHQKNKFWYSRIANIRLFYFNSRGELEKEEKQRIKNNEPLFNVIYNTDNVEQAIIDYCVKTLGKDFIFENNKWVIYNGFEYQEIPVYTFYNKLFECVEYILPEISYTSPQFKRIKGEVFSGIESLN